MALAPVGRTGLHCSQDKAYPAEPRHTHTNSQRQGGTRGEREREVKDGRRGIGEGEKERRAMREGV